MIESEAQENEASPRDDDQNVQEGVSIDIVSDEEMDDQTP